MPSACLRARQVLDRFDRWPTWMWANLEVAAFIDWLRQHNAKSGAEVGFYGLDVYSLWESMDRIVGYLREHQPDAVDTAVAAFQCFEPYAEDHNATPGPPAWFPTAARAK